MDASNVVYKREQEREMSVLKHPNVHFKKEKNTDHKIGLKIKSVIKTEQNDSKGPIHHHY